MYIRSHVKNPELILSTIALHAVFILFSRCMKKAIDNSTTGKLNVILHEIVASFMFVALIFEKGLWYENVNENYFHIATAAQYIFFVTFAIGASNPLGLIRPHGILTAMAIFPFQIMGGLAGARFMREVYWPLGMTQFHSTLTANQCSSSINTELANGALIESLLCLALGLAPYVEKEIGRLTNVGEDNAVLVMQSIVVAYVVKTYITVTGAMMNPLLAVVVNFQCLTNVETLIEHVLFYWAGPIAIELLLILATKSKTKVD